ncbi:MAG: RNA polymerase sigma factor [Ruminococcus sp.]|nr:RNA polymerase sigma factor [Candidatus Apopatosoma intestinale]
MDNGQACYRRYLDGDKGAFDELIVLYHDSLIAFVYGQIHNQTAAEDIAADAFAELLLHPRRYSFQSSFKTYLFAVARHKSIDWLRREKRWANDPKEIEEKPDEAKSVEALILSDERAKEVRAAMKTLKKEYGTVLYLTYFEEMSGDEICRVMKKSKKQTANLLYRAKAALKEALREEGLPYEE